MLIYKFYSLVLRYIRIRHDCRGPLFVPHFVLLLGIPDDSGWLNHFCGLPYASDRVASPIRSKQCTEVLFQVGSRRRDAQSVALAI